MDMQRPLAVPAEPWCSCTCMPMASTTHASSDQVTCYISFARLCAKGSGGFGSGSKLPCKAGCHWGRAATNSCAALQGFLLAMAQDVLVATEEGVGPSGALLAGAALQLLPHFLATTPSMHLSRRHLHHAAGLVRLCMGSLRPLS